MLTTDVNNLDLKFIRSGLRSTGIVDRNVKNDELQPVNYHASPSLSIAAVKISMEPRLYKFKRSNRK